MRRLATLALALLGCGARTTLRDAVDVPAVDVPAVADASPVVDAPPVVADVPAPECPVADTRRWQRMASPTTADLISVFAVAADDVWIAAQDGSLFRYDGSRWSAVAQLGSGAARSLWFASRDDGWAIGSFVVLRWDGRRWNAVNFLLPSAPPLGVVWGATARDVWLGGGTASQHLLVRFDGERFVLGASGEPIGNQVVGLTGTAPDDVWAVFLNGRLAHFDGARWGAVERSSRSPIGSCVGVGHGAVSCSGYGGYVHHITEARTESERVGGAASELRPLWHAGGGELWAFGRQRTAAHRAGGRWSDETIPTDATINAVHGRCPTDAWAVGEGGTVLRLTP